jgi:S-adenosylmethionine decarboxylase
LTALGKHLLLELMDCDHELLNDIEYLRNALSDVATQIGATVIKDSFYQFTPQGVSGVVIIAESHVSIHTWPEHNYAAVDVFTCGDVIRPSDAVKPLAERLKAKATSFVELERGMLPELKAVTH